MPRACTRRRAWPPVHRDGFICPGFPDFTVLSVYYGRINFRLMFGLFIGYRGASCGQRPLFFCAHGMNGVPAGSCVAIRDWPCGNPQLFPAHPQALHKSSTDPSTGTGSESLLPGSWGGAGAAQVPAPGPNARLGLAAGHRMPPGTAAARERGGPPPISDLLPAWQLRPARHRQAP